MGRWGDGPTGSPSFEDRAVLVSRRGGRLALVTQPDHAALAGWFAEHWGNDQFVVPAPRDALVTAATHHDDGWLELDVRPMYNADRQRPAHFIELPLTETVGPYGRGVESVYARNEHAGALVSMHFSGFYTGRWGVGGGDGRPSDNPIAQQVVATQEARWMPALREAWGYRGRRSEFDAGTWHAYEVLQAVDLLSLAHGLADLEQPAPAVEPIDVTATLARIEQSPGPRFVTGVPVRAGGPYVAITLTVTEPGLVHLDPYPLHERELEFVLPVREIEDRAYADADDAARAFHSAPVRGQRVTVTHPH
jgi:Protein of unknown function (DUF3891)